jgi:hypothetical protein
MKTEQLKDAKINTRVYWDNNKDDKGLIVDKTQYALFIKWDNGDKGWIDNNDLDKVYILEGEVSYE